MKKKYCSHCGSKLKINALEQALPKNFKNLNEAIHKGEFDFTTPEDVYMLYKILSIVDKEKANILSFRYIPKEFGNTKEGFKFTQKKYPADFDNFGYLMLKHLMSQVWVRSSNKPNTEYYRFYQKNGNYGFWLITRN